MAATASVGLVLRSCSVSLNARKRTYVPVRTTVVFKPIILYEEYYEMYTEFLLDIYTAFNQKYLSCIIWGMGMLKIKSVALQLRRAKTDWSGCCLMTVQGALWLAKRLSLNLNISFLNWISLLLISSSYPIVLTRLGGPRSTPCTSWKISRV